jgi:hypothetical protein
MDGTAGTRRDDLDGVAARRRYRGADGRLPAHPLPGLGARPVLPGRPGHPVAERQARGGDPRRGDRAGAPVGPARGGLVGLVRDAACRHRGGAAGPGRHADRRGEHPGPPARWRPAGPGRPRGRPRRAGRRRADLPGRVRGHGARLGPPRTRRRRARPRVPPGHQGPGRVVLLPGGRLGRRGAGLVRRLHAARGDRSAVGGGHPAGVPAARRLPGRAGRTAAAGPCPRRDAGPGEGTRRDVGSDPGPGRVRRLRHRALLLALTIRIRWPPGCARRYRRAVMHP